MKRVAIIGGGFAGLSALRKLTRSDGLDVTLIDQRVTSDYLPLLPDVVGQVIRPATCAVALPEFCKARGATFQHATVRDVDVQARRVATDAGQCDYDGLVLAAGAVTNWHGRDEFWAVGQSLDSLADARAIGQAAEAEDCDTCVVCGGGYTGVELATNLIKRFIRRRIRRRVVLVELTGSLCPMVDEWMQRYVLDNVRRMGVEVRLECGVDHARADSVTLSDGQTIPRARLFWAAGVRAGDLAGQLDLPTVRQGRLAVDQTLRLDQCVYAAGDMAGFVKSGRDDDSPIRLSIQHAIGGGLCAGDNLARELAGGAPKPFKPLDLGFIVPMGNGRSCGHALGVPVKHWAATTLHYVMCSFRAQTMAQRLNVLADTVAFRHARRSVDK